MSAKKVTYTHYRKGKKVRYARKRKTVKAVDVPTKQKKVATTLVQQIPLLPKHKKYRFPYYEYQMTFASGINSIGTQVYTCNGMYDVDISGTGHQPMGFDQIMTLYNHYTVTHSEMEVTFRNRSANPIKVGIMVSPNTTVMTDYYVMNENGTIVTAFLQPNLVNGSIKTLNIEWDGNKYFGEKDITAADHYAGDVTTNPAEQAYYHLVCYNPLSVSSGNESAAVTCEVRIIYHAVLNEPKKMPTS